MPCSLSVQGNAHTYVINKLLNQGHTKELAILPSEHPWKSYTPQALPSTPKGGLKQLWGKICEMKISPAILINKKCRSHHRFVASRYEWAPSQVAQWWRNCLPVQQTRRCGFDPRVWKISRSRKWWPTPGFLLWKYHEQRSLMGYRPWIAKESDMTEYTYTHKIKIKLNMRKIYLIIKNFCCLKQEKLVWEALSGFCFPQWVLQMLIALE